MKSKSPSIGMITSTLSEIECTPYTSTKMTFEKSSGHQSIPLSSMAQSTSARTPKHSASHHLKENESHGRNYGQQTMTNTVSLKASRLASQQSSDQKSKTPNCSQITVSPLGANNRLINLKEGSTTYLSLKHNRPASLSPSDPIITTTILDQSSSCYSAIPKIRTSKRLRRHKKENQPLCLAQGGKEP